MRGTRPKELDKAFWNNSAKQMHQWSSQKPLKSYGSWEREGRAMSGFQCGLQTNPTEETEQKTSGGQKRCTRAPSQQMGLQLQTPFALISNKWRWERQHPALRSRSSQAGELFYTHKPQSHPYISLLHTSILIPLMGWGQLPFSG